MTGPELAAITVIIAMICLTVMFAALVRSVTALLLRRSVHVSVSIGPVVRRREIPEPSRAAADPAPAARLVPIRPPAPPQWRQN